MSAKSEEKCAALKAVWLSESGMGLSPPQTLGLPGPVDSAAGPVDWLGPGLSQLDLF